MTQKKRVLVGVSGASGSVLAYRLLQCLREQRDKVEIHLILTPSAVLTMKKETNLLPGQFEKLADFVHDNDDLSAGPASGSWRCDAMLIVPCSVKTLSAVASCRSSNLLQRSADVRLKEGTPLLLAVRETPLHAGHVRRMREAVENGAILFPPVPSFYSGEQTVDDILSTLAGRMLKRVGIENFSYREWTGGDGGA